MRIANRSFLPKSAAACAYTALLIALGSAPFSAPLYAGEVGAPLSVGAPAPIGTPVTSAPAATPAAAPVAAVGLPLSTTPPGSAIEKSVTAMEDKITDSAKSAAKRLDTTSDATSLADLNSVRQTITRIEAMIDIEKRLNELEKLRNDRNSAHSSPLLLPSSPPSSLASAIPASALLPAARGAADLSSDGLLSRSGDMQKRMGGSSRVEVVRISGAEGRYAAVLKMTNGDTKTVRVGDQVSGDETVRSITSSSVVVGGKGKVDPYTLRIKNAGNIYSAMR